MKKKTKKKVKKKNGIIKKIIPIILIIVSISIFSLITPIFNITEIKVEGNEKVETDSIISLSGLKIGENLFRNSKSKVKNNIKENTYIDTVTMKREPPGTISLVVKERKVEYQIKLIDGYVYIDNQGYILDVSSEDANLPFIEGFEEEELLNEKRLTKEDLKKLNTIIKIMEAIKTVDLQTLITSINAANEQEYILYLKKEKKYAYIGDASNLNNKVLYMQTMIEKEKKNSGIMFLNGNISEGFKPYFREEKIK